MPRGGRASVGVNAAYDASSKEGGAWASWRYGAEVHLERGGALVTAEMLYRVETPPGGVSSGAYVTAGYALAERHRLRVRLDHIRIATAEAENSEYAGAAVEGGFASDPYLLGAGYTFMPGGPLRLEVDYLVPLTASGFEKSTVLVNVQVDL